MLLLVHVHVRPVFGMIDTIGKIVEKRIDWNQSFNYLSDPFCDKVITFDKVKVKVKVKVRFRRICMESSEHNWASMSETICPTVLVFGK